jgi:mannose-1-phosphate guanylyltransferase
MRALLLAAGYGTRLKPLTDTIPKCMVPIKGQPLLDIWLQRLSKFGIGPFLINTHYLARQVEDFIEATPYREKVKIVNEKRLKGTAGTIIENINFFQGEDSLLIHADNYCMADFRAFQQAHSNRPSDCLITMMTFRTDDPSSCGIVEIDKRGVVIAFYEKVEKPPSNLANGAVYILSAEMLRKLQTELFDARDFSTEVLNKIVGRIYTYETKQIFVDIGTPERYRKINEMK